MLLEEELTWREGAEKAVRAQQRLRSRPVNYSNGGMVRLEAGMPHPPNPRIIENGWELSNGRKQGDQ